MKDIKVSLFENAYNTTPISEISLPEALERIKTGASQELIEKIRQTEDKDERNKLKLQLPAYTLAGTFEPVRNNENIKQASGLAGLDFDHVSDPAALRDWLIKEHDFILTAWISPSGNGVKAIALIPEVKSDKEFKQYYEALLQEVDIKETDPKNKDIARLCFESFDPDIKIKDFDKVSIFNKKVSKQDTPAQGKINDNQFKPILAKLAQRGEVYTASNRENFIFLLACETNRAGIPEDHALNYALSTFKELTEKETTKAIKGVYDRNPHEFNTVRRKEKIIKSKIISAMERNHLASTEPDPKPLYYNIFNENEIAISAGDTGVGKSLLAVYILEDIARKGTKVLYYDFELSPKQFEARYKGYQFSENFFIADWEPDSDMPEASFNFETIITDIEETGIKIICIDNITALSLKNTVDPDAAIGVMRGLKKLQKESGISVLVLAHTPKRQQTAPLTINDLAGSKHLANFADSVFFINFSKLGDNIRYIKHIKTRTAKACPTFGVVIEKGQDGMIRLEFDGYLGEHEHLTGEAVDDRISTAANLRDGEHRSQNEIAQLMKLSQPTVNRLLRKYDDQKMTAINEVPF